MFENGGPGVGVGDGVGVGFAGLGGIGAAEAAGEAETAGAGDEAACARVKGQKKRTAAATADVANERRRVMYVRSHMRARDSCARASKIHQTPRCVCDS
jgi:hypothetical protein